MKSIVKGYGVREGKPILIVFSFIYYSSTAFSDRHLDLISHQHVLNLLARIKCPFRFIAERPFGQFPLVRLAFSALARKDDVV
jgi:hypothetical protein